MLRMDLQCGRDLDELSLVVTAHWYDVDNLGPPKCERPGLVEGDSLQMGRCLQVLPSFDENSLPRSSSEARDNAYRS